MVDLMKKPTPTECFVWTWSQTLARLSFLGFEASGRATFYVRSDQGAADDPQMNPKKLDKCLILLVILTAADPQINPQRPNPKSDAQHPKRTCPVVQALYP